MRAREVVEDIGLAIALVLLLPLAIPIAALAFLVLLGQRLHAGARGRMQRGFTG